MMKHDIDFKIGEKYYIDEVQNKKECTVILKRFWEETMLFCLVENEEGHQWETMLYRLTEIK